MSFTHGRTGYTYYSVREKIDYYTSIVSGARKADDKLKAKAKRRLPELQRLDNQSYNEPRTIVVDDTTFGNPMSKPRLCIAVREDNKNRVMVAPLMKVTSNYVILDNNIDRQISRTSDGRNKWVKREDIYEDKYITPRLELTERDIAKIKRLYSDKK